MVRALYIPPFSRVAGVVLLLAGCASACVIDVDHPAGRRCDAERPCSRERVCVEGFCADDVVGAEPLCGVAGLESAPNLVANDSFEAGTSGWAPRLAASLARVSPGLIGNYALEVTATSATNEFGIENENPRWVPTTSGPGARYCFSAWVRSEVNTRPARIRVREYYQGTQQGASSHSQEAALSPSWQRLDAIVQTVGPAGGFLDFQVTVIDPSVADDSFEVDAVSIRALP